MITELKKIFEKPEDFIGKEVEIAGWIRQNRDQKSFGFIELNDGTAFKTLQLVYDDKLDNFDAIKRLGISSAITARGKIVESPKAKQKVEMQVTNIHIDGDSPSDYPLQKKRHSFEYLRTIAHLRPRTNTYFAAFKVRSVLAYAIHKFFQERDYIYCHAPIITGSDAEGAGDMFRVTTLDLENVPKNDEGKVDVNQDFFNKETHLTVSGQLEAEIFAQAFKKTYTFGPTFRAENSNTQRHAAEFWMIEPEVAFADLDDIMQLGEDMLKFIIKYTLENAADEMQFFNDFIDNTLLDRLNDLVNSEFKRMTYTEAIEILEKADVEFKYPVKWGIDLQTEHERYISEQIVKGPVFVTNYPKEIKAFYMRLNDDEKTVAATDLLVPGVGEIIGGSQREERYEILEQKIIDNGMDPKDYWWYLELRKYGTTKHAGFGLGFERALMYITGMKNIRDIIPFPRTVGNAEF